MKNDDYYDKLEKVEKTATEVKEDLMDKIQTIRGLKEENKRLREALEEIADLTNPNELKYIAWPSANYMRIAREALRGSGENE